MPRNEHRRRARSETSLSVPGRKGVEGWLCARASARAPYGAIRLCTQEYGKVGTGKGLALECRRPKCHLLNEPNREESLPPPPPQGTLAREPLPLERYPPAVFSTAASSSRQLAEERV
eukprot:scaffold154539_cov24-Tisochrysis_lutea.AAC.1